MKRIAWLTVIAAMLLVGTASAAYVAISAPQTVNVGEPLEVTGTTITKGLTKPSLNPGFSTEVVLYYAQHSKREVDRKTIVVQQDGSFSATFETSGLAAGLYTIELIDPTQTTFGGSSTIRQIVTLVDRSGSLTVNSPLNQDFDGYLDLQGAVSGIGSSGVQIQVEHDGFIVYGPEFISTDANGGFGTAVPISSGGSYKVTFADTRGYIDTRDFVVSGAPTPTETPGISASAPATRSAPAYFEIDTRSGTVTIATSAGIDWVVEYIDEDERFHKVNNKGLLEPETAEFAARGGVVYVKVYPMSYNDSGTVQISAANAESVRVSQAAPALFGDATPTPAQAAPLPVALALLGLVVVVLARRG
ncbi:hypothetical protein [Methanoculleus sp.]|uniref:hypothetical protein n=1 Tax=Methanoculleus sp. TaxID=90427 RepID=UPI0025ED9FA8|nr:hypothetical protein [Methanoculleus sp.]